MLRPTNGWRRVQQLPRSAFGVGDQFSSTTQTMSKAAVDYREVVRHGTERSFAEID